METLEGKIAWNNAPQVLQDQKDQDYLIQENYWVQFKCKEKHPMILAD